MGGTSCDVGIIIDGDQQFSTEFEIEWGLPVAIPTIEVRTLGAGGGSIAWIDKGGLLNVGPQSAGGDPGPACYGAGGTAPTVTDANLLLGRLNPLYFLGGEVPLDFDLAAVAMDGLAVDMGVSRIEAAIAVIDIANENMTNAIRILSIELGIEPCDFALVAFGGAGPLHAAAVARKLGIVNVVVPPHPGLCSAFGAAISELRVEKVQTFSTRHQNVSEEEIRNRFDAISKEAEEELRSEGLSGSFRCTLSISMRYYQQNYEEDIEYRKRDGLEGALSGFHERHRRQYGYHFEDETIELVHFKVSLVEEKCSPDLRLNEKVAEPDSSLSRRSGYDVDGESSDFFVYRREALALASHLSGPAIVEEVDSTTFLPSGFELRIDGGGNFLLNEAPQSVTK
jgi:N-methylhydantoinase A